MTSRQGSEHGLAGQDGNSKVTGGEELKSYPLGIPTSCCGLHRWCLLEPNSLKSSWMWKTPRIKIQEVDLERVRLIKIFKEGVGGMQRLEIRRGHKEETQLSPNTGHLEEQKQGQIDRLHHGGGRSSIVCVLIDSGGII